MTNQGAALAQGGGEAWGRERWWIGGDASGLWDEGNEEETRAWLLGAGSEPAGGSKGRASPRLL